MERQHAVMDTVEFESRKGAPLRSATSDRPAPVKQPLSLEAEKLAMRIERQIRRATSDKVRELRVEVRRDSIVLEGRCGTFYCKQLASHAAMALSGTTPLVNHIDVW